MIWFYRDFLDGFVYVIFAILSLVFIMAIIGFILERLQLEKEEKNRVAVLNGTPTLTPPAQTVAPSSTNGTMQAQATVASEEVVEKNDNAVTNDNIPDILDLNAVEKSGTNP